MTIISTGFMALQMMSAMVPGTNNVMNNDQSSHHTLERQKLLDDLLDAAKKCYIRFGGRAELATESDACVAQLCSILEAIFSHGLRTNCIEKVNFALKHVSALVSGSNARSLNTNDAAFWPCIKDQLTWHEQERFSILRKVRTDYGRGRAWLRAILNERSLERNLHTVINPDKLSSFYEEWAFLLDQEKCAALPNVAAGLSAILFAIRIENEELDNNLKVKNYENLNGEQSELIISIMPGTLNVRQGKVQKKVPTHIISFDNDSEEQGESSDVSTSINERGSFNNSSILTKHSSSPSISEVQLDLDDSNAVANKSSTESEHSESLDEGKILTPVTDSDNLGLVLTSPLDQTFDDILVSLPNYINETTDITEPAVEATEHLENLDNHTNTENLDAEALRSKIMTMDELLEQAREDAMTSRLLLNRFQRQHQNLVEKHQLQLQTLNGENELLRQQLRKYVTAVQMLRKESDSTYVIERDVSPTRNNEAEQYEAKLIQVADMHAELMEFNSRLILQLANRDKLIKILRTELECLRGPFNEDELPLEIPCFIHIWIPSVFLTGQPSDIHHVYQIYIRIRETEWNIYRRYAQFYELHKELIKHDAIVTTYEFPPKKTIGNKDAKFVEERRQKLQEWLRRVVGRLARCSTFSSNPSRQTLISLLPFFGDRPNADNKIKNNTAKNALSSSPQYMGL
ncbi:PREDICTED: sorting nexin-29 [Polistes canadensis]|uniref:sorting nexin-29 n=1 Tax=Polistes canadensis TaxID=91411 RepID=UPI000718F355|nr:PREDICTED: sorting nexin-29 [Polistes canadensis]